MPSKIHFISDLHLASERPEAIAACLRFLTQQVQPTDHLYILGDLFDVWIGDDAVPEALQALIETLQQCSNLGTRIFILPGNRDFLLGEQFAQQSGCQLLPDPSVIHLNGQAVVLTHGDLLCTDDQDYQRFRHQIRHPAFIADFLAKSSTERQLLAQEYRRRSGEATSLKSEAIMDVNQHAVIEMLQQYRARLLIHGHTHRPAQHSITLADGTKATRWVLAEWIPAPKEVLTFSSAHLSRQPFLFDGA